MTAFFCCYEEQSSFPPDPSPVILSSYGGASIKMPRIAFGTDGCVDVGCDCEHIELPVGDEIQDKPSTVITHDLVLKALRIGFRHIDCGEDGRNEGLVGEAMADFLQEKNSESLQETRRKDIFLTSKYSLFGKKESIRLSLQNSLQNLQTSYIDLYLLSSPFIEGPWLTNIEDGEDYEARLFESWTALEDILISGSVRSIGVSNFRVEDLKRLQESDRIRFPPVVNQVEGHPLLTQPLLHDYCINANIKLMYYSSLVPLKRMKQCRRVLPTMELLSSERKQLYATQQENEDQQYRAAEAMVRSSQSLKENLERISSRMGLTAPAILIAWGIRVGDGVVTSFENTLLMCDALSVLTTDLELMDEDFENISKICESWHYRQNLDSAFGTNWSG